MYVYTYLDNVIPSCERSLHRARATCLSVRRACLGTTWKHLQSTSSGLILINHSYIAHIPGFDASQPCQADPVPLLPILPF